MIVDYETDIYQGISDLFVEKGFEIETITSRQKAIQKAQEKQYNIALLDIDSTDIEGIDLLENLKQTNPNIDVIIVSHERDLDSILLAFNKGVSACFLKPLDIDNLIDVMNISIQNQRLIDEKRQVEQKLRESEEKYRHLVESVPDAIYSALPDETGTTTFMSNRWKDWTGYSPEDFYKDHEIWPKSIHQEDRDETIKKFINAFKEKTEYTLEYRVVHKITGEIRYLRDHGVPIFDEKGKISIIHGVVSDITENKEAERKLRESKKKYRLIIENSSDLIVILNQKFEFEYINEKSHKNLIGYTNKDTLGKSFFYIVHPEDFQKVINCTKEILSKGESQEDLRIRRKDGNYVWLQVRGRVFIDIGGEKKILIISRDITQSKLNEIKLEKFGLKLKERIKELTCLYGISKICENPDISIDEIIHETLNLIPPTFQYPTITYARIIYDGKEYKTLNFKETPYKLDLKVKIDGKTLQIDVCYLENKKFLKEERDLIRDIGNRLNIIIKQKIAGEKLKESEERFRILAEQALFGIGIAQDNIVKYANQKLADITGYSREEILQWKTEDLIYIIHPDDKNLVLEQTRNKQLGLKNYLEHFQHRVIKKSGEIIWLDIFSKSLTYNGKPADLVEILDITERKKLEEDLIIKEKAIESSINGIAMAGLDGVLTYVNPQFLKMWGYSSKQEVVGKHVKHFWKSETDAIKQLIDNKPSREELIGKKKDDTLFPIQLSTSMVLDKNKNLLYMVGSFIDISEKKEAEQKLIESEEKLQILMNSTTDAILLMDSDGTILQSNELAAKNVGKRVDELFGMNTYELFPPDIAKFLKAQYEEIFQSGRPVSFEKEFFGKFYDNWNYPIFNNQGKVEYLAVFAHDITERKNKEEELRKSEEQYRRLVNNLQDCIWSASADGKSYYVSSAIETILGFTVEEILSDPDSGWNLIHPDYQEKVAKAYDDLFSKKELFSIEYPIKRKDGKYIWVYDRAYKTYEKNGELFANGILGDITERKKTEQKLKESEEKLREFNRKLEQKVDERTKELKKSEAKSQNILNNISDALLECNSVGIITYITHQIQAITGYQPKELIGLNLETFIHPDDLLSYKLVVRKVLESKEPFSIDCKIQHKKGYHVPISVRLIKMKVDSELKIFGVLSDNTEKEKVSKMIKKELKKLKELDKIRNNLIRRISHELKTPLVSICGAAEFLLDSFRDEFKDDTRGLIEMIEKGGKRLKYLVNNLITTCNIETNELKLELKRENINQIIKDCIEIIMFQAKKRDLFVNIELLNELYFDVDKSKISLVISEILLNAVRNTPPGGSIFIKTFEHHNYIDIIIKDTGVGFTRKEIPILFKKFGKIERFGKGLVVDIEGPGLGLYISKEIVKMHNGEILLKSKGRNKGSTIIIRLYVS